MVSLHPRSRTSPVLQSPAVLSPQPLCPHHIAELCTFLSSCHMNSFAKSPQFTVDCSTQELSLSWRLSGYLRLQLGLQKWKVKGVTYQSQFPRHDFHQQLSKTAEVHPSFNSFHPKKFNPEMTQLAQKMQGMMLELPYDLLRSSLMGELYHFTSISLKISSAKEEKN